MNFFGTGLSAHYDGLNPNNPYPIPADQFTISGFFSGVPQTYTVRVANNTGTGNSTPRQFNLLAPVVIPEAGAFALFLPALAFAALQLRREKPSRATYSKPIAIGGGFLKAKTSPLF